MKCTIHLFYKAFLDNCTKLAADTGLTSTYFVAKFILPRLICSGWVAINLQSFYMVSSKEAHAWSIQKDTLAPQAACIIHTDFEW